MMGYNRQRCNVQLNMKNNTLETGLRSLNALMQNVKEEIYIYIDILYYMYDIGCDNKITFSVLQDTHR